VPTSEAAPSLACREGYSFFSGSCYTLVTLNNNYEKAANFCNSIGSFLVSIGSQEELDFVISLMPEYMVDVAIGLNDVEDEGTFVYTENGQEASFTAWADGQPRTKNNFDCVFLDAGEDYAYKTMKCKMQTPFVCEYHPNSYIHYVGALPVNGSIATVDSSLKKHLYIPRPYETLSAGRVTGFYVYASNRGRVTLTVLRPTNVVNGCITDVSVVDYVSVLLVQNRATYVELDAEVPVENGDLIGVYFPKRNPIAFVESDCEHGSILSSSKPDLEVEISVDNEGLCRDYFIQAVVNTGPAKRSVATLEEMQKRIQQLPVIAKLYELMDEIELLEE